MGYAGRLSSDSEIATYRPVMISDTLDKTQKGYKVEFTAHELQKYQPSPNGISG